MKKTINNNRKKTIAIICSLFLFGTIQAQNVQSAASHEVEMKYMGNKNGSPIFQINLQKEEDAPLYLVLKDEYGNMLYTENIKDKSYSRNLVLEDADISELKLKLMLYGKKSLQSEMFQVNKNTRTVNDVSVAKL